MFAATLFSQPLVLCRESFVPIGAHVSTSGGLSTAVGRARKIGAECMQVFLCQPQRWRDPEHADDQMEAFITGARENGVGPNFAHAIYLINMASDDPTIRERSINALSACVSWSGRCGLDGTIVHVGSAKAQPLEDAERNVVSALEHILAGAGSGRILLENSAGSGRTLGARFQQLGALLDGLGRDERVGVCVDTAHAFASGYDLRTADGLAEALDDLDRYVGLDRLWAIHANDSKAPLASALDRHENIGQGHIGEEAFERMLHQPSLVDRPWILEVPGYEKEGPDLRNIQTLRRLAGRPPVEPPEEFGSAR